MKIAPILLVAVYLLGLALWLIPSFSNPIPYGEGDASIHYFLANAMVQTDKPVLVQPKAVSQWEMDAPETNPHNLLINAPQYHTSLALFLMQNNFYIFLAVMCSLSFFTIYLLLKNLYNPVVGLIGAFMVPFSLREQLTFIWGQWATAWSFALVPLIILLYFLYTKEQKKIYLGLLIAITVTQFLFHPLGVLISFTVLLIYSIILVCKDKKLPFKISHVIVGGVIFVLALIALEPFQLSQIGNRLGSDVTTPTEQFGFSISRLFGWYNIPGGTHGIPQFYFSFNDIYYGYWLLVPLIIGILLLLFRRSKEDWLMLSTLAGFYIITHLDLIGIDLGPKYPRLFYFESLLFIPIIAIGVYYIVDFIKDFKFKNYVRYGLIAVFGIAFIYINAVPSLNLFNSVYTGVERMNVEELTTAQWVSNNVPDDSYLLLIGFPTFKQATWFQAMVPGKVAVFDFNKLMATEDKNINKTTHFVIDYSFLYQLNRNDIIEQIQQLESNIATNSKLIYDDNNMKVYAK